MKQTFFKYPSIENSNNIKTLNFFLELFPDLVNCKFAIEDKIDGSSFTVIFKPNGEFRCASRNQLISHFDSSFYGINSVLPRYEVEFNIMRQVAIDYNENVHFHCELFGPGILDRVKYGPEKQIRIYGIRIGEELKSPSFLYEITKKDKYDLSHMLIPVLGIAHGIQEALDWNCEFIDPIFPEASSSSEGIVIKPFNKVYKSPVGEIFYLKKKSERFKEVEKSKRLGVKDSKREDISPEFLEMIEDFQLYITESRMYGVFSKEGKTISNSEEMGFFIKQIMEDAKKDWYKDNPDIILTKSNERLIFNVGKKISKMLLECLKNK